MTNHWIDIRNSDCILIMGSNPAENHPVAFKWVEAARERGATVIHVDPRFTRTSSKADIYAPLRPGTDIAFLGGMIRFILSENRCFRDYVAHYTNAACLVSEKFAFHDGLFSGFDPRARAYDRSFWAYETNAGGAVRKDPSLSHPRTVFQLLKTHFARYTPEKVSAVTGTPREDLLRVYECVSATGRPDRAGTILYAMGWTQHTVGVQNIRAMAIIQLLLGNMGMAGGGVNALRGESNVQGSTDHGLLYGDWPGYLPVPRATMATLSDYLKENTPSSSDPLSANWWQNRPKYVVSFLKALFGEAAIPENGFCYAWLPKLADHRTYTWLDLFDAMDRGELRGFFAWGQNPACSGADAGRTRAAMAKLDWMVSANLFETETAAFWKGPGMDPRTIRTEVFLLPCAASMEKEGSITNSGRWAQWRWKAQEPPGEARSDGDILTELFAAVRALYQKEGGAFPEPITHLAWDYRTEGRFDAHKAARGINGRFTRDATIQGKAFRKGDAVPSFALLQENGSTASGNWLYCQSYNADGNQMARRGREDPTGIGLYPQWAWSWPMNRRILYNRAAVDLQGRPWNPQKPVIRFIGSSEAGRYVANQWEGDVPDGGWFPMQNPDGSARPDSRYPFIMRADGLGGVFGPGLLDGPFPEHYEPVEGPASANLMNAQQVNPLLRAYDFGGLRRPAADPRFPIVATTCRVAEHWQSGAMSRSMPWLLEAEPQMFVEMSRELARQKGIRNGDRVVVASARGSLEAVAMVTSRLRPFKVNGAEVHVVGLPWHYGWLWPHAGGDSANLLTPSAGDPNTRIPETKAFMVSLQRKDG
ncbi:Formate dehydrogenase subunit alpha [uncultured Desulfatiglans sp.]|nr:Formate dehydrogenase subunit alpha [uncultured Desulfatiglans sp.]